MKLLQPHNGVQPPQILAECKRQYYVKKRDNFLEVSRFAIDAGELVGKDPREMPPVVLLELENPSSPIRAIRSKCLDCSGGSEGEVRKCVAFKCALWAFRMGKNPFHGRARPPRKRKVE